MQYIKEKYWEYEYEEVVTPNIFNFDLWKTSGHSDHYKQNMFHFDIEKQEFGLKPMNCPGASIDPLPLPVTPTLRRVCVADSALPHVILPQVSSYQHTMHQTPDVCNDYLAIHRCVSCVGNLFGILGTDRLPAPLCVQATA